MELSIAPAAMAMAMGLLAKNPKMINHRYASEMQLQHRLSPACSVMFNKQCSYRITRKACSVLGAVSPIQCTETSTESLVSFKDFLVSVQTEEDGLIKLRVTVADTMTESIFEKVFSKNVAAAQPLPGFRRMKGGLLLYLGKPYFNWTNMRLVMFLCFALASSIPGISSCMNQPMSSLFQNLTIISIPKEIALHLIGPSKVKKETIKNIISLTIAEYVQKEDLDASKNLKVLQTYEELEAAFEPGKEFCFDATFHLQ
uniref:Trigger factor ribosome-binding bacterial domain-containing protein n=1 Tax=Oryza barthii TaxID=65489 RepID=A0A0D3H8X0_9ORYZ